MVTHDAFVASYSTKMLYMKDGKIDKILNRHGLTRDEYFNEIVKVNAILSNN
jgi:ABC-type lipoprotein export system ATPase subunit